MGLGRTLSQDVCVSLWRVSPVNPCFLSLFPWVVELQQARPGLSACLQMLRVGLGAHSGEPRWGWVAGGTDSRLSSLTSFPLRTEGLPG